jgi:hypothetical protein
MRGKLFKWIVLITAIGLPLLVLFFLRHFGRNVFEVPILYTDSLPHRPAECLPVSALPYVVPDSVRGVLGINETVPLTVLGLSVSEEAIGVRIRDQFANHEVDILMADTMVRDQSYQIRTIILLPEKLKQLKDCFLFVPEQKPLLVLDSAGFIRGHYGTDRDETDRLMVELSILLRKY